MVKPGRSDSLLALGKKLSQELGTDQRVDTLSRWMSHWIAELMCSVDDATGEERRKRMAECGAAIMRLWAHRNTLPDGKRPFESFEPIFRTLESLDPEAKRFRYLGSPGNPDQSGKETPSEDWLNRARSADEAARGLVKYCLGKAADLALEGEEEWIALAKSVMSERDEDLRIIIRLFDETEASVAQDMKAALRGDVETRIGELEMLVELAQLEIAELKTSINR